MGRDFKNFAKIVENQDIADDAVEQMFWIICRNNIEIIEETIEMLHEHRPKIIISFARKFALSNLKQD